MAGKLLNEIKEFTTPLKEKIMAETFWSLASKAAASIFFLLLNVFLARYLGPENYGSWSYFFAILNILFLISYLGINQSARKYVAEYKGTKTLIHVLKSSLKLRLAFSAIFALFIFIFHKQLAEMLGRSDFEVLFLLSVPLIFLRGFVEYFKFIFQGFHKLKYNFITTLSEHGLRFFAVIVLLPVFGSLASILFSFNIAIIITLIVGSALFYFGIYSKNNIENGNRKDDLTSEILKYSIPLLIVNVGTATAIELDTVMIGVLSTDAEVGIYSVAKQIISKLPHIAIAIGLGAMPVFAKLNSKNKEKLQSILTRLLKINGLIFFTLSALILATSWFFIPTIFGSEYSQSVAPLMILTGYLIIFSYIVILSFFLDYRGLAKKRAINMTISVLLNILLNLLLIPKLGAIGASISTTFAYIPYLVLNWYEVKKEMARIDSKSTS